MNIKVNFSSKPLFEKTNISETIKHNCKYLFLLMIYSILCIATLILVGIGFQYKYLFYELAWIPESIQIIRAITLFLIGWTTFISLWLLKLTIENCKYLGIKKQWSKILYFIPIVNTITYVYLFKIIKPTDFSQWFCDAFKSDPQLKQINTRTNKMYIFAIFTCIIMTPLVIMIWMPSYSSMVDEPGIPLHDTWFGAISYFTIQTNLFCWVLVVTYLINPSFKIFKSKTWFIICVCDLFIVSSSFLLLILPFKINDGSTLKWSTYHWVKTMWEHALNPAIFLAFGLTYLLINEEVKLVDYLTTIKYAMIIPTIYLFYVTVLPFVCNHSVYDFATNCNPNLSNGDNKLFPYGRWYMIFNMILYWFVFVGISTLLWFAKEKMRLRHEQFKQQQQKEISISKQQIEQQQQ